MMFFMYLIAFGILWATNIYGGEPLSSVEHVKVVRWGFVVVLSIILLLDVWREYRLQRITRRQDTITSKQNTMQDTIDKQGTNL